MRLAAIAFLLPLAACGTAEIALPYTPPTELQPAVGQPTIALGAVRDARGIMDPTRLGQVITHWGGHQMDLRATEPVAAVTADAFGRALAYRGRLPAAGTPADYELSVDLLDLRANRHNALTATADVLVVLTETRSGRQVWVDREREFRIDSSQFTADVGPVVLNGPAPIARLLRSALDAAVDAALDRPAMAQAMRADAIRSAENSPPNRQLALALRAR